MTSRKFLLSIASLAIAGLLVVPFAADAVTQSNNDTGPNSINKNKVKVKEVKKTVKKDTAAVNNAATVTSNTGGNKEKHNTTGGSLTSGGVTVAGTVANTVNQSTESDPCCCSTETPVLEASQDNTTTGPDSTNINSVKIKHKEKCLIKKDATVNNALVVTSNTGDNVSKGNTQAGDLTSGDVGVTLGVTNTVN